MKFLMPVFFINHRLKGTKFLSVKVGAKSAGCDPIGSRFNISDRSLIFFRNIAQRYSRGFLKSMTGFIRPFYLTRKVQKNSPAGRHTTIIDRRIGNIARDSEKDKYGQPANNYFHILSVIRRNKLRNYDAKIIKNTINQFGIRKDLKLNWARYEKSDSNGNLSVNSVTEVFFNKIWSKYKSKIFGNDNVQREGKFTPGKHGNKTISGPKVGFEFRSLDNNQASHIVDSFSRIDSYSHELRQNENRFIRGRAIANTLSLKTIYRKLNFKYDKMFGRGAKSGSQTGSKVSKYFSMQKSNDGYFASNDVSLLLRPVRNGNAQFSKAEADLRNENTHNSRKNSELDGHSDLSDKKGANMPERENAILGSVKKALTMIDEREMEPIAEALYRLLRNRNDKDKYRRGLL